MIIGATKNVPCYWPDSAVTATWPSYQCEVATITCKYLRVIVVEQVCISSAAALKYYNT